MTRCSSGNHDFHRLPNRLADCQIAIEEVNNLYQSSDHIDGIHGAEIMECLKLLV